MNIFASFSCPVKSAEWLDDQRQVKMPLEAAQMLSCVSHVYGVSRPGLLKMTHVLHPCVLWVCEYRDNYEWLWEHMLALDSARRRRVTAKQPKVHSAVARLIKAKSWTVKRLLPYGSSPNVNCARHIGLGIDYTHIPNVHKAYRLYLNHRWAIQDRPAVCTLRNSK